MPVTIAWWDSLALLLAAAIAVSMWRRPSPAALRQLGEEFAGDHLAYVDSEFVERFDELGVQRRRLSGVLFGALAVVVWMVLRQGIDWDYTWSAFLLAFAAVLAASAAADLLLAGREFPAPAGRAVIARVRHVSLTDYLPPITLAVCALLVVLELAVGVVSVLAAQQGPVYEGDPDPAGVAVAAFVVAGLTALAPVHLTLVCRRPEAAVDRAHLYLQDAWRASILTRIAASLCFGAFGVLGSVPVLEASREWQEDVSTVLGLAAVGAALWLPKISTLRFRKRLWPELGPGEVIRPAAEVVA